MKRNTAEKVARQLCDDDVCIITSLKGVKAFTDRVKFADADDDEIKPF